MPSGEGTIMADVDHLVQQLKATLDAVGNALVEGGLDDLVAAETQLAALVSGLGQAMESGALTAIPSEIDAALDALRRCQRLGSSFETLSGRWLETGEASYDRSGRAAGLAAASTLNTRV